jgi:hypothetical protein
MFEKARLVFDRAELNDLGEVMEARKQEAMAAETAGASTR